MPAPASAPSTSKRASAMPAGGASGGDHRGGPAAAGRARRVDHHQADRLRGRDRRGHDLPGLRRQGRTARRHARGVTRSGVRSRERCVRSTPHCRSRTQLVEATELIQQRVVDVWTLLSHLGPKRHDQVRRPMTDSPALTAIFAAHADRIRVEPAHAARMLRALTLSLTHPMIAAEASAASDIVDTVLHGVGTGTPT